MSLNAYQMAQKRVESPRETEYRLFATVTRALINAQNLPTSDFNGRMRALDWNRRVWNFMANACSSEKNQLPEQLRASIISLSIFVSKYSSQIMKDNEDWEPLIDINRSIMQGLAMQAGIKEAV